MNHREKKFFEWVYSFGKRYDLRMFEIRPHQALGDGFDLHTYVATMNRNGDEFMGTGAAHSRHTAILIALVECVERQLLRYFQIPGDSNGNACHFSLKAAQTAACLELLERDAFFSHYLADVPALPERLAPGFVSERKATLERYGAKVEFHRLWSGRLRGLRTRTSMCVIQLGKPHGILSFGTACSFDLHQAQMKALNEALIRIDFHLKKLSGGRRRVARLDFRAEDHLILGRSKWHVDRFKKTFFGKTDRGMSRGNEPNFEPDVCEYSLFCTEFSGSGLRFVRAESKKIQSTFWGYPKKSDINFERLKILRPELKASELPWRRLHLFP